MTDTNATRHAHVAQTSPPPVARVHYQLETVEWHLSGVTDADWDDTPLPVVYDLADRLRRAADEIAAQAHRKIFAAVGEQPMTEFEAGWERTP